MNSYVHKSAKECLRAHRGGLTDWDGWVQGTESFVSGSQGVSRKSGHRIKVLHVLLVSRA